MQAQNTDRISRRFHYILIIEFFVEDVHCQQVVVDHILIAQIEVRTKFGL